MTVAVPTNWQRFEQHLEGVQTQAELCTAAARTGHWGMRLTARPENPAALPVLLETPPLWIVSPAVLVQAGDLLCIRGWVRMPTPLAATFDGLLIFDSFSGQFLAERIGRAAGWRNFVLYRVAPRSGPVNLTFALTGLGEAWLDDVTVQVMVPAPSNPMLQGPQPVAMPH